MKRIPNLVTLLNLFFGCIAILFALQTENIVIKVQDDFSTAINIPERLSMAAVFIFFAAIVDFLDGFVARLFNATSELGKQLDSLSDVVSFGVAPAAIMYQLLRISYARFENGLDVSILLLLPAFIISCAAAYRLGKFNLDASQSHVFRGVPTPAVALFIASLPLILHFGDVFHGINDWLINVWVLYFIIIAVSWLMISNIPMLALKFKNFTIKDNLPQFILLIIAVLAAIFLKWLCVPLIFVAYIILSLAYKNKIAS